MKLHGHQVQRRSFCEKPDPDIVVFDEGDGLEEKILNLESLIYQKRAEEKAIIVVTGSQFAELPSTKDKKNVTIPNVSY